MSSLLKYAPLAYKVGRFLYKQYRKPKVYSAGPGRVVAGLNTQLSTPSMPFRRRRFGARRGFRRRRFGGFRRRRTFRKRIPRRTKFTARKKIYRGGTYGIRYRTKTHDFFNTTDANKVKRYQITLSNYPSLVSRYTPLFAWYRIRGYKWTFVPRRNTSHVGQTSGTHTAKIPIMHYVPAWGYAQQALSKSDTLAEMMQIKGYRRFSIMGRPKSVYTKPMILRQVQSGTGQQFARAGNPGWISTQDIDAQHYLNEWFLENDSDMAPNEMFDVYVTAYWQFRGIRIESASACPETPYADMDSVDDVDPQHKAIASHIAEYPPEGCATPEAPEDGNESPD